jgi:hypothetical protein
MRKAIPDRFESLLSVAAEDLAITLAGHPPLQWLDFLLNPRRLRGSDFLMRWSQGRWAEDRIVEAINSTGRYYAIPYGPSSVAPSQERAEEFERYFDRLQKAGLGKLKRPDLLVFRIGDKSEVNSILSARGGLQELPFIQEADLKRLLQLAIVAIECETSLWIAEKMPDYNAELQPQRWLGNKPGLRKGAVAPTIILKDEDRRPLKRWQRSHSVAVHLWHLFYDLGFGIALEEAEKLIRGQRVRPQSQVYQAPGGPTTTKRIFKIYHHYSYQIGRITKRPKMTAASITDKNGHILPYVRFEGGRLDLSAEALAVLDRAAKLRHGEVMM